MEGSPKEEKHSRMSFDEPKPVYFKLQHRHEWNAELDRQQSVDITDGSREIHHADNSKNYKRRGSNHHRRNTMTNANPDGNNTTYYSAQTETGPSRQRTFGVRDEQRNTSRISDVKEEDDSTDSSSCSSGSSGGESQWREAHQSDRDARYDSLTVNNSNSNNNNNNDNNNHNNNNNSTTEFNRGGGMEYQNDTTSNINFTKRGKPKKEIINCQVCGDLSAGYYCSAYTCVACKKFFIRSKKQDHLQYVCQNQERCEITKESRVQCQFCRYQKCLKLNMSYSEKGRHPKKSGIDEIPCRVCSAPSSGFHFGALTCEGCKAFFRRIARDKDTFDQQCLKQGSCEINFMTRTCKTCRYKKCLEVGMSVNASRIGRLTNAVKHAISLEVTKQAALRETNKVTHEKMTTKHDGHAKPKIAANRRESVSSSSQMDWTKSEPECEEYGREHATRDETRHDIDEDDVRRKKYRPPEDETRTHTYNCWGEHDVPPRDQEKLPLESVGSKLHSDIYQNYSKNMSSLSSISEKNIIPFMKRPFPNEQHSLFDLEKGNKSFKSSYDSYYDSYSYYNHGESTMKSYHYPYQNMYKHNGSDNSKTYQEEYNISLSFLKPSNMNQQFSKYNINLSDDNDYKLYNNKEEKELYPSYGNTYTTPTLSANNTTSSYYQNYGKEPTGNPAVDWNGTRRSSLCDRPYFNNGLRKYLVNTYYDDSSYHHYHQRNGNDKIMTDNDHSRHNHHLQHNNSNHHYYHQTTHQANTYNNERDSNRVVERRNIDQYNNNSIDQSLGHRFSSSSSSSSSFQERDCGLIISPQSRYAFKSSEDSWEFDADKGFPGDYLKLMLSRAANELSHMCASERAKSGVFDEESFSTIESTWSRMMRHFEFHSKCVVRFVKRIPGFKDLKVDVQIGLIQRNTYPLVALNQGRTYEPGTGFINYFNFTQKEEERVQELFPELHCLRSHFLHSGRMALQLKLSDLDYAYISCLLTLTNVCDSPDVLAGDNDKVAELKKFYTEYLYESEYYKDNLRFREMLHQISEFSRFSVEHDHAVMEVLKRHTQLNVPLLFSEMYQ